MGLVDVRFDLAAEDFAEGGEVAHGAEADELGGEVADGRAFEGEGVDRQAARIGRGLAEQSIFRAAADNQDASEFATGETLEGADCIRVALTE